MLDVQTTALATHETVRAIGLLDLLLFPWNVVMHPDAYDGWSKSPGGLVLLLGLPGLFVGGRKARWLGAFSGIGIVCFYFFQRFARYLLPFFVPMMVVAAVGVCRMERLKKPVRCLLALTFCYGLGLGVAMVHFKIPVAFGLESREAYLERRVERYPAFVWANEHLSKDSATMTFDLRSYYIDAPTYQKLEILRTLAKWPVEQQVAWFKEHNIRYIFYPNRYIETAPIYEAFGFPAHLKNWREDHRHFRLLKAIEMPSTRSEGTERVEIYEVIFEAETPHVDP